MVDVVDAAPYNDVASEGKHEPPAAAAAAAADGSAPPQSNLLLQRLHAVKSALKTIDAAKKEYEMLQQQQTAVTDTDNMMMDTSDEDAAIDPPNLAAAAHPRVALIHGSAQNPSPNLLPRTTPEALRAIDAAIERATAAAAAAKTTTATAAPAAPAAADISPAQAKQIRAQQIALSLIQRNVAVPAHILQVARGGAHAAAPAHQPPPPLPPSFQEELLRRTQTRHDRRCSELDALPLEHITPEARLAALNERKALQLVEMQRRVRSHVLVEKRLLQDIRVTSLFDWRAFRRSAPMPAGDDRHLGALHGGLVALDAAAMAGTPPPNVAKAIAEKEAKVRAETEQREAQRKKQEYLEATLRLQHQQRQMAVAQAIARKQELERQRREVCALAEVVRLRRKFMNDIVNQQRDFRDARFKTARLRKARYEAVEQFHKRAKNARTREEAARLKALRADNMEEYIKMAKAAKNQRVNDLLGKTDAILVKLGAAVEAQRAAVESSKQSGIEMLDPIDVPPPGAGMHPMIGGPSPVKSPDKAAGDDGKGADGINDTDFIGQKQYHNAVHRDAEKVERQPEMLRGGELRPYQLVGLQWMVSLYINNLNGILADEMGLGKTIQTISFIAYLMEYKENRGPFLIVAPKAVLPNWRNEFMHWLPQEDTGCVAVLYDGNNEERKAIRANEMSDAAFNVVLTHYDLIMRDRSVLQKIDWEYIIIDEGHRLKNSDSKLAAILQSKYSFKHRMLLTGTPIQNNLHELWSLLNFILPSVFQSSGSFDEWFAAPFKGQQDDVALTEEEQLLVINRLHQVIRPFLLRRKKAEVEKDLPDKVTQIIKCDMSYWQKHYYTQIVEGGGLHFGDSKRKTALMNTAVQLRKVCNHPYLFDDLQPDSGMHTMFQERDPKELTRAAGKFDMLERVLFKLKKGGHRVLLFSQMTKNLNIIEEFLQHAGYQYLRLDGATKTDDRGQMLQQFNQKDSDKFIFLLSTRAGGLGLNLQTADTVILFDSDWNPQMDAQAEDRAHRIGQKRQVLVLIFVSASTIEEDILERAHEKRKIDRQVIQAGMFNDKANAGERKEMLEAAIKDSGGIMEKVLDIPDDEQMNRLISRDDDEFEMFMKIDADRDAEEKKKHGGKLPPRLLTKEELPEWVLSTKLGEADEAEEEEAQEEEEFTATGRRSRKSKSNVTYVELTDQQFERAVERGDYEETMEKKSKKTLAIREKRSREAADKKPAAPPPDGDDEDGDAEPPTTTSKRPRRSGSRQEVRFSE